MTTAVLVHREGITLASIPRSDSRPSITPLPLPSRFPPTGTPKIAVSPSGHFFLFSANHHIVWEYDAKGRRVSEMSTGSRSPVRGVCALGSAEGKETVCVAVEEGGVRVMEKGEGKWKCINTLDGPGAVRRLVADKEARHLLAVGSEVILFDQKRGSRRVLDIPNLAESDLDSIAFAPTIPKTLIVPSAISPILSLFDIASSESTLSEPFGANASEGITGVAFSPIVGDGEKRRGGLCAVCKRGSGQVALVGLEASSSSKMVDFGEQVDSVAFLDGASLAATSTAGKVLVKDLRALDKGPSVLPVDQPVMSLHIVPQSIRKPVPASSAAAPSSSARHARLALAESKHADNVGNLPPGPLLPASAHGKGKESGASNALGQDTSQHREHKPRSTSMPSGAVSAPPEPPHSSSRAVSATHARQVKRQPPPRAPAIEEEPEEEVHPPRGQEGGPGLRTADAGDVTVSWALHPPVARPVDERKDQSDAMDEMRREIGNLQLDLLRMGRSLRNEIRMAVQPLMEEVQENRRVIELQRKEIERLRAR